MDVIFSLALPDSIHKTGSQADEFIFNFQRPLSAVADHNASGCNWTDRLYNNQEQQNISWSFYRRQTRPVLDKRTKVQTGQMAS